MSQRVRGHQHMAGREVSSGRGHHRLLRVSPPLHRRLVMGMAGLLQNSSIQSTAAAAACVVQQLSWFLYNTAWWFLFDLFRKVWTMSRVSIPRPHATPTRLDSIQNTLRLAAA